MTVESGKYLRGEAAAILVVALLLAAAPSQGQQSIPVGETKRLFCDTSLLASLAEVSLTVNPPTPVDTVMVPDRPWEARALSYFNVLEDQGLFKMWYGAYEGPAWNRTICYATSLDGLNWTRADIGLVEYLGSYANNILPIDFDDGGTVFIDPQAPAAARYKILGIRPVPYIYESPDGIDFVLVDTELLDLLPDSHNQMIYDARLGTYVAYLRSWNYLAYYDSEPNIYRTVSRLEIDVPDEPWPYTPIDSPLFPFGPDRPAAISTEFDIVMALDSLDPPDSDIYNPCVNQYLEAANAYFAFPSIYYHSPQPPEGDFYNDGILRIQVAFSPDGIAWHRFRTPYVDNDVFGDSLLAMYMAPGLLRVGDGYYQYFNGVEESHGDSLSTCRYFALRQRLDGFVSLDAGAAVGHAHTRSITFEGNTLQFNYATDPDGYVLVELLDSNGVALDGFSMAEADTLRGDDVAGRLSWSGLQNIGAYQGIPIRLHIELRRASLFSFQFLDDPALSVTESQTLAHDWHLNQNYPNPFNATTQISFSLKSQQKVTLRVYNILGRQVVTLIDRVLGAGDHRVTWDGCDRDGTDAAGGVYFYALSDPAGLVSKKMILLK